MVSGAIPVIEGCQCFRPIETHTQRNRSAAIRLVRFGSDETQQASIGFTTPECGGIVAFTLFNMFKPSELPETTAIIDHLGRPFQGSPQEYDVVLGWARFPNTVMKLSLLPAREEYPHRDVGPVIPDLVERFGPDRLIYGGGLGDGATGASDRAYRERVRSYLADLSPEDQAKVLGGTAARVSGSETRGSPRTGVSR